MPRVQFAGTGKLIWVPDPTGAGTVVTLAAPTVAQINSGTDVTAWLRRDGLSLPQTGNVMDTSDMASRTNSTDLGTVGGDKATVKFHRDSIEANDDAWPLFAQGERGFLVVFRLGIAGASPAAADRCEVYQSAVISRSPIDPADNVPAGFSADLAIQASNQDAVVAA
jgi:hypothetical protein